MQNLQCLLSTFPPPSLSSLDACRMDGLPDPWNEFHPLPMDVSTLHSENWCPGRNSSQHQRRNNRSYHILGECQEITNMAICKTSPHMFFRTSFGAQAGDYTVWLNKSIRQLIPSPSSVVHHPHFATSCHWSQLGQCNRCAQHSWSIQHVQNQSQHWTRNPLRQHLGFAFQEPARDQCRDTPEAKKMAWVGKLQFFAVRPDIWDCPNNM